MWESSKWVSSLICHRRAANSTHHASCTLCTGVRVFLICESTSGMDSPSCATCVRGRHQTMSGPVSADVIFNVHMWKLLKKITVSLPITERILFPHETDLPWAYFLNLKVRMKACRHFVVVVLCRICKVVNFFWGCFFHKQSLWYQLLPNRCFWNVPQFFPVFCGSCFGLF